MTYPYSRPPQQVNNNNNSGIGFIGLLTIVFITLKLTGYINWSWFWVLSPMIFSFVFIFLILLAYLWIK